MSDPPDSSSQVPRQLRTTENQTFTRSIEVSEATVSPMPGLYQAVFPLGEADFLRIKSSSPWLTTAGGAVLSFGLAYALPFVVQVLLARRTGADTQIGAESWWVSGVLIAIGSGLLIGGRLLSRERQQVLKRIEAHFLTNPAELAHRIKS